MTFLSDEQTWDPTKLSLQQLVVANRRLTEKLEQMKRLMSANQKSESDNSRQEKPRYDYTLPKIELGGEELNFSGNVDEDPDWWGKKIRALMQDYRKHPRRELVRAVGRKLKGNAWRWFVEERAKDPDRFYTWEDLVTAVKQKFANKHLGSMAWNELVQLKQEKMSTYDYIAKFEHLASRARPKFTNDQLVILFCSGLGDVQAARDIEYQGLSLSEAYDLALCYALYEVPNHINTTGSHYRGTNQIPSTKRPAKQRSRRCFYWRQLGHLIANCPSRQDPQPPYRGQCANRDVRWQTEWQSTSEQTVALCVQVSRLWIDTTRSQQ
jgi:hypothetical protein